jgi:hypothetical protein
MSGQAGFFLLAFGLHSRNSVRLGVTNSYNHPKGVADAHWSLVACHCF